MSFLKPQTTASPPPKVTAESPPLAEPSDRSVRAAEMTPEQLQQVIARDPVALSRFMDVFGPPIHAVARRFLVRQRLSLWTADDLLHDVVVALFSADAHVLRSWNPTKGRSLRNYLIKFAEFRITDRLRREPREEPMTHDELFRYVESQNQPIEINIDDLAVARRALEIYFAECTPGQRQFAERLLGSATAQELMEEFQVTRNTYDKRVSRLGARLREIVKNLR